ncbi:hypothetical protein GQ53DRAFT_92978 [Thozetella sp. PMI_491]|nr:hypothetical protein GQ53DRAFT_92978 [Thozetella sp. PMI_491]
MQASWANATKLAPILERAGRPVQWREWRNRFYGCFASSDRLGLAVSAKPYRSARSASHIARPSHVQVWSDPYYKQASVALREAESRSILAAENLRVDYFLAELRLMSVTTGMGWFGQVFGRTDFAAASGGSLTGCPGYRRASRACPAPSATLDRGCDWGLSRRRTG